MDSAASSGVGTFIRSSLRLHSVHLQPDHPGPLVQRPESPTETSRLVVELTSTRNEKSHFGTVPQKMASIIITLAALTLVCSTAVAVDLPSFIQVCKRNDPSFEKCIIDSVETLKPTLAVGAPEWNIPSLEPLRLSKLVASENTGIRIVVNQVDAYGASNFNVNKVRLDLDTLRFGVEILLPLLYINGVYEIDGRVLLLPIRGSGPMTGNFTDVNAVVKMQASLRKDSEGLEYLNINDFRLKISIRQGSLKLENLFGGDPTLGNVVNSAINSNFDSFIKELQPAIERALGTKFREIAQGIIDPFTFEQLFPTD